MPCESHFAAQPAEYRDSVLPPAVRARVSVEAAATFGWHRWIGDLGEAIGMHSFGASGSEQPLYEHFGITAEHVVQAAARKPDPRTVELKGTTAMSTLADVNPQLKALTEAGVSVWLDQLGRSLVAGGELKRMVEQESLRGVTSNPSIFEKSILGTSDYDDAIEELARAEQERQGDLRRARGRRRAGGM